MGFKLFRGHSSAAVPSRRQAALSQRPTGAELEQRYAFRRNQTLTGSTSSSVSSLNETQANLKSPRVHGHLLRQQRRRLGALFLLIIAACGGLMALLWQFTAVPEVQAASDPSLQLSSQYESDIQTYFASQPLERLRPFLHVAHLKDYLQSVAPEIKDVQLQGNSGFGKSLFELSLRHPVAEWGMGGQQLFVDETGTPFTRNYFSPPTLQIIDQSHIEASAGQAIASNRFLGFVGQVINQAQRRKYTITQVIIPAATTHQIELHLGQVPYPVKFSVDRGAGEQVEDMDRAIQWMKKHNLTPQYIDVRVGGRAYYRS